MDTETLYLGKKPRSSSSTVRCRAWIRPSVVNTSPNSHGLPDAVDGYTAPVPMVWTPEGGTVKPYAAVMPGQPSVRLANSVSRQAVTWLGLALANLARSDSVLKPYLRVASGPIAIA